ncbi:Ribosome-recycling factor [Candidatus Annandia adelgestsuga]|uniref:Ribosome-recycling factor n=1 Tax=Candidatus Annandia adelgestsuga TaxID=1302411 RepID=A0A3S9J7F4_9ENTR|nr:ribosome recycling factor [Candidatus Annandia adelgestsuga]AZP36172.1 Ribosome-recycling factor [Candidatus Annandia adelgestsuga]
MINQEIKNTNIKMKQSFKSFKKSFMKLQTGRASVNILDNIMVIYYDKLVPLKKISHITVENYYTLKISVFDQSSKNNIKKAIVQSNLGLNPIDDKNNILINIPQLTEERRKKFIKIAKLNAENSRISVRNQRKDKKIFIKKLIKNNKINKDEEHFLLKEIQNITNKYIKKIDNFLKKKEKELMKF